MIREKQSTVRREESWEIKVRIGLNDIANRCFRNTADDEYLVARMAFRANLLLQFNWSALHSLEKYLKAICLYNRISSKGCLHNLRELRRRLDPLGWFRLKPQTVRFMDRVQDFGGDRYLSQSWMSMPTDLLDLDRSVWDIRRFCRVLNPEFTRDPEGQVEAKAQLRERLLDPELKPHDDPPIDCGRLEEYLDNREHPARAALVWMNPCFGRRRRRSIKVRPLPAFENSPAFLYPEIVEEARQYVHWPSN